MPHTGLYLSLSIAAILLLAPPAIAGKGNSISLNKVTKVGKLIVIKDSSKLGATLQESSAGTVEATIRCKKSGYRAAAIGAVKLPKKSTVVTRQAPAYFLPNWCKKDKDLTTLDVCQSGDKQFKIIVQACKDGIPHVKLPVTIKGMCAKVKTAVGPAKMGVWSVFPLTWSLFDLDCQGFGVPVKRALRLFWSGARTDNFSASTSHGAKDAAGAGYTEARIQGYLLPAKKPGTAPLRLFYSAKRKDNFSAATAAGVKAAKAAGYKQIRIQGYVHKVHKPDTRPLKLFYSASRKDNFITATPAGEKAAKAAGYKFVRVEGYLY